MSTPSPTPAPLDCATASSLEIWMLTTAIVVSYLLSALPVKASSKMYEKGRRPLAFSLLFILLAIVAISLCVATLILGHSNVISLDAIAAIVFALIPSLVSFPRDAFTDFLVFLILRHLRIFPYPYHKFAYITVGRACKEDVVKASQKAGAVLPTCAFEQCDANIYIRRLARRRSLLPSSRDERDLNCRWNGVMIAHSKGVVTLRNTKTVPEHKWYLAVSRSVWFVMQPWTVHLNRPAQVAQALRLVADIIAIGRLVIHYRGKYIKRQLENMERSTCTMSRTALEVCNSLIREMGLTEWREVDFISIRMFREARDLRGREGEVYNVLLFFLVMKSKLFGEWFEWKAGSEEFLLDEEVGEGSKFAGHQMEQMEHGMKRNVHKLSLKGGRTDGRRARRVWRTQLESAMLQWAGIVVHGRSPFSSPSRVAAFRHRISAQRIVKHIANLNCSSDEVENMIRKDVDSWLSVWGCDTDGESE